MMRGENQVQGSSQGIGPRPNLSKTLSMKCEHSSQCKGIPTSHQIPQKNLHVKSLQPRQTLRSARRPDIPTTPATTLLFLPDSQPTPSYKLFSTISLVAP